jgi:hypothetical protein
MCVLVYSATFLEKTTDLSQAIEKFHITVYRVHLTMRGIRTHNFSVDKTDWIGSGKSKYHAITTTMDLTTTFSDCQCWKSRYHHNPNPDKFNHPWIKSKSCIVLI